MQYNKFHDEKLNMAKLQQKYKVRQQKYIIIKQMSSVFMFISKGLKKIDLFPNNSFIRYNGQDSYTTVTGGFTSLLIIVIFIALFARMGVLTVNRDIIQSSTSVTNDIEPPSLKVTTNPDNNFMFSILLYGFDLTNPALRLFNITLWQYFYSPGFVLINQTQVPLVACTTQHFTSATQDIFKKFNMSKALCPPIGHQLSVGGKITSEVSSVFTIFVDKCNSTIDPACASNATLENMLSSINDFTLVIPILNTELNPDDSSYKTVFLQDRNYFSFNLNMGVKGTGSIQQVSVQTDESIMPYQQTVTQEFTKMAGLITAVPYLMTGKRPYAQISFNKATFTTSYTRSFNKVDNYFSYVGGLIGTIIGLIFILNLYTQKAYEISIAHKLFKYDDNDQIKSNKFNILYFFCMLLKNFLEFFKCKPNWPKTQMFMDCCDEISLQLDITYLIRKMMFLETALQLKFKQHQYQALYLIQKPTITMAMNQRRKMFTLQIMREENQNQPNQNIGDDNSLKKSQHHHQINNINFIQNQRNEENLSKDSSINGLTFSKRSKVAKRVEPKLIKVIQDCKKGNLLSKRILSKVDRSLYPQVNSVQQVLQNRGDQSFQPIKKDEEIYEGNEDIESKKQIFDYQIQK